jgi:hypothetical protein
MKKLLTTYLLLLLFSVNSGTASNEVRSWIILSDNVDNAISTIKAAKKYDINQLQFSHHIIHDLKEVKDKTTCDRLNSLIRIAHAENINEVLAWDHSFYSLDYYPNRFKTGPKGTIDLDNPEFWQWYKDDYRRMMDLIPDIDGLVLTFIETGAYAEKQYSAKMPTSAEKLAAVVNAVADVVIEEKKKKLYIRTFAYSEEEYNAIVGCIKHIENEKVALMMKEVPHDFFLTHPNDPFIGKLDRSTIVEFDTGNEYNGQGVLANTWPEYVMKRWKDFIHRPNVVGYTTRTDRYGTTKIVDTPNEILLYALKRTTEDPYISEEQVYDEFITARYGKEVLQPIKNAFKKSFDIISSVLYTLGTNTADHSALNYEFNKWSYNRHVSGRWIDPPLVFVKHGINKEFHYWKDVVNHIAPLQYKTKVSPLYNEAKYVLDNAWVDPYEQMDSIYYNYILTEKRHGVKLTSEALEEITKTQNILSATDYEKLYQLFNRTHLTARLHEAVCTAYYGYRIYKRETAYHPANLRKQITRSLDDIENISNEMRLLKNTYPVGQYNWLEDANKAMQYKNRISEKLSNK